MSNTVQKTVPREPQDDPRLGIPVDTGSWRGRPPHRLVAIGDSLTQGFQSGAIFHTDLSYPAVVAHELGWAGQFRRPTYDGFGGLPFNIERFLRELETRFGQVVNWWESAPALWYAHQHMDEVERFWEVGAGNTVPARTAVNHNLAVFGWDLRDALVKSASVCAKRIGAPRDNLLRQLVEHADDRAALRVLPAPPAAADTLTQLTAAAHLGDEVGDTRPRHGIETLVVFLGANNALRSVVDLKVIWSDKGYDDLDRKGGFTVWRPEHFRAELGKVADRVRDIKARHVIWCTVPHVTIAPIARGVATKTQPGSPYFPYYTRPWISDRAFDPTQDPHITGAQAQEIDTAIDHYNHAITDVVRGARNEGRDWYLLETVALLDRLGSRRYIEDPLARPPWWQPYPLPPALRALTPQPNTRFLASDGTRRTDGGLFSLDGVHPTTVGYGILAQELINVMRLAGVEFFRPDGVTPRRDPVLVDFDRLVRRDTLLTRPPGSLTSGLGLLAWADEALDLFRRVLRFAL
ncbi:hypothetical protein [Streptomyces sp. HD]|uniref:hypothetical protein n=1 Tax=Streptomyces sp. HD TaxID=3020892 RepID=UPI0023307D1A|nr:hypothetical protein [Streptomyces sp. HD]MDC0766503.1 hypothetical protein [Streptomyces sp. HD]